MAMFPMEAARELRIRAFHNMGSHQYVITLLLQCGDDVQGRVLDAFRRGQLPSCLFRPTLEYVALAVRESLSDVESVLPMLPRQLRSLPSIDSWLLELEERRWPRLMSSGLNLPTPPKDLTFWCAYDFLLRHRASFFRTIGTLEESYLKEFRELKAGRLNSISQLQMRQSIEMENVYRQTDDESQEVVSRDVQALVAQHVGELDAVELHWRTEIEQLKVRQKASYRNLIVDRFEQEVSQLEAPGDYSPEATAEDCDGRDVRYPSQCAVEDDGAMDLRSEHLARPLRPGWVSMPEVQSERLHERRPVPEGRIQEWAEVRAVFGQRRVFFVLRLWVGDVMDLLRDATGEGGHADDGDGAGPQLPPELVGLGSYGDHCFAWGSGLAASERVGWPLIQSSVIAGGLRQGVGGAATPRAGGIRPRTAFRSPSFRFWEAPVLPDPVRLSPNAYAACLRGLIIPTPENLKFASTQAVMLREFSSRCDQVTELHFASLPEQLRQVKAATEDIPLKCGDYICTRHSNLGGALQVAFHLLMGSSEAVATDEIPPSVHRALKRIVCDCHTCHVGELSLPLLLLDIGTSESSLPYAVAQRRSENALRALKGALTQLAEELAPSETPNLGVLNLVLPASCATSIGAGVPSVAESALTFLRHSFQSC